VSERADDADVMTPGTPTVSVIVPTHNRARLLPLTLHSVLWQQEVALEVIVIDDGSTDDTHGRVRELDDPRIRLLRHEAARGVSVARNRGVAEARGRWIAFLDDDDLWAPDKLVMQVRAAEQEHGKWVYAGAVNVTEDLRLLGGAPPADPDEVVAALPRTNLVPGGCSGVVVRRDLLPSEPFDPSLGTCADWDLWIRLSRLARPVGVKRPLVGYRVHAINMSLDTRGAIAELAVIEARYGGPIDRVRFHRHLARISLRASRHRSALGHYFRAATVDRKYRSGDFLLDLIEVAQGVGRTFRNRIARTLIDDPTPGRETRPGHRYAAQWAWVEQARPWLDELAAYRRTTLGHSAQDAPSTRT
jgi:glycosyltransferase involved in cell wall biosynthesis